MDEEELILFLEAVKESTNNNESDLEEVKSELEVRNNNYNWINCHCLLFNDLLSNIVFSSLSHHLSFLFATSNNLTAYFVT